MKKRTKILAFLSTLFCSTLLIGATGALSKTEDVATASASTTTTTILNDCELAANGAIEAVGSVELSTEYAVQGNHSVKVTTTGGWAPLLIFLKKDGAPLTREQLTNLEYIEITIYNTNTNGMSFYFYNHDMGWVFGGNQYTTLQISGADFLAQIDGGNKGTSFDPYSFSAGYAYFQIPNAGTIYIDNVVGVFKNEDVGSGEITKPDSMLNNCDVVNSTMIQSNGSLALDATLKTEGNSSTRVTLNNANGGYILLGLYNENTAITTQQLLTFDYLCMDINNLGSANRSLFLCNTLAAELVPGWNKIAIPMSVIKAQIEESANADIHQFADGYFYLGVYAQSTLLIDNVRGMTESELYGDKEEFGKSYYSAVAKGGEYAFVQYGATQVNTLTAAQAAAKGLPTGYTDNVIEVVNDNTTGKGILLDFSSAKIPTATIESMTIRMFFPDDNTSSSYPSIRIHRTDDSGDWVVQYAGKNNAGTWFDFTLNSDGTNFNGSHNFSHLSANGFLDKFELGLRTGNTSPFYIDSISFALTTDVKDTDAPVISYGGAKTVYTLAKAGNTFSLDATAHDRTQGALTVQYIWSDTGAVNSDGSLKPGTYTLTLKAEDTSGNTDTMELKVIAVEPENNAPIITLPVNEITLTAGTKPQLIPHVADDSISPVTITKTWSQGALNHAGRLLVGTHTYTIVATDLSGNTATKTVTVHVTQNDSWNDNTFGDTQHVFGNWLTDTENHWKACTCGETAQQGAHVDTDNNEACDTCAYPMPKEDVHTHDFSGNWLTDTENHWKACACGETAQQGAHVDNDNNEACDTCAYPMPKEDVHTHDFNGNWLTDTKNHWKACTCGETAQQGAHVDTDNNETCDTCAYPMPKEDVHTHDFNGNWLTDTENHWKACVCGETAQQGAHADTDNNKACDTCAYPIPKEDVHTHDFSGNWLTDTENHWKACACGETAQQGAHTDTDNNETCDTCAYPMPNDDNQGDDNQDEENNQDPDNQHVYENVWQYNETSHWKNCSCGDKIEQANHVDENKDGKCDVCEYQPNIPSVPTNPTPPQTDTTNEESGTKGCKSSISCIAACGVAFAVCMAIKGKKKDE